MHGIGADQNAHIDPRAGRRAADAPVSAGAARHLGGAAHRFAQRFFQVDRTAGVAIGGKQDAWDDDVVLRPVHVHLLQRDDLLEEREGVLFRGGKQQWDEKRDGRGLMAAVADKMSVFAGAIGRGFFSADRAAQRPRLAEIDKGFPAEQAARFVL